VQAYLICCVFPLGIMNIVVIALVTALIFAEKSFPIGQRIALLAALALIAYGVLVLVVPGALPTMHLLCSGRTGMCMEYHLQENDHLYSL